MGERSWAMLQGVGDQRHGKRAALHVAQLCRRWLWSEASLLHELTWGLGDAVAHRGQQVAQAREDASFQSKGVPGAKRKPELEAEEDRTPCVHHGHIPAGLALLQDRSVFSPCPCPDGAGDSGRGLTKDGDECL